MDQLTLSGSLAWVFNICVLLTSMSIIILGTWCICNYLIWEILIKSAFTYLRVYKIFAQFIYYRKIFIKWARKNLEDPND